MLKITNEGRKLALDQRLINPLLPDNENSKTSVCANEIYKIWQETTDKKSTQLVFCDLSVPKNLGSAENPYEMENVNGVWKLKEWQFTDVYTDLKRKLIEKGIPENEIAFIHEADSEAKKEELFDKVRCGEVRVLMGSTFKMGAGTNVQDKIVAIHHLDCTWKSSDLEQRNGRGVRQGNENALVHIFNYVTKGTFDAYMYQLVEKKQRFISQIMTSKTPIRSMEDIDERALTYAEIKALATNNPLIVEKTQLEAQVSKLKLLKQNYLSQKYELEELVQKKYPHQIKEYEDRIANMEEDKEHLNNNTIKDMEDNFIMRIENNIYTEKAGAGEKILNLCKNVTDTNAVEIGEYRGFKMELEFNSFEKVFQMVLKNKQVYRAVLGSDKIGIITRINNTLDGIEKLIENNKQQLENLKVQYKNAQEDINTPFKQEQEYKECSARLAEVNRELKIGGKDDKEIIDIADDDEDVETKNKKSKDYER